MPVIETALIRLLGIEHPILLAPMGSVAGRRLAAAVTHAGRAGPAAVQFVPDSPLEEERFEPSVPSAWEPGGEFQGCRRKPCFAAFLGAQTEKSECGYQAPAAVR